MKKPTAVVVAIVALTVLVGTAAAAGPVGVAPPGPTSSPIRVDSPPPGANLVAPVAQPLTHSVTITLVTGDKLRLDPGPGGVSVTPLAGGSTTAANFTQYGWNGDQYVIPNAAVPYLSSTLDPRLFDVSYLAKAGLDDAHSTTVPVAISGNTGATAIPGLHVALSAGSTATATLAKAQAAQFGRLLVQQWRASKTGASSAAIGTLPGIGRISLAQKAGAPALPTTPPTQPPTQASAQVRANSTGLHYHTLTINTIDMNGDPGTAVGFVHNVDNAQLGSWYLSYPGLQGPVKFSVPDGTYSLEISVLTGPADDFTVKSALVVKPQFTISSDTTLTLDARTAVPFQPTLQTPPPDGSSRTDLITFNRQAAVGGGVAAQAFGFNGLLTIIALRLFSTIDTGNQPLYATPTSTVSTGTLNFAGFTEIGATSDDSQGLPRYKLVFPTAGKVPSSLTYPISDASLITVKSKIYANPCAACSQAMELFPMVYLPWGLAQLGTSSTVTPGDQTDYWYSSAPASTIWQSRLDPNDSVLRWAQRRTLAPGQQVNEVWNKGTMAPSAAAPYLLSPAAGLFGTPDTQVSDPNRIVCAACRQDDTAILNLLPYGDSAPDHFAAPLVYEPSSTVKFWRDGTLAVTSDGNSTGALAPTNLLLPMLSKTANYRLAWSYADPSDSHATSDTVWTFASAPTDTSSLPSSEDCIPDPSRACSFLPLLFPRYDLPVNYQSQAPAGSPAPIAFTITGQQNAPAPTGLAATLSASYDGGATWSPAQDATGDGNGGFTATIAQPDLADSNGFVSLRVTAQDAAGNTVEQTTIDAYGLTN